MTKIGLFFATMFYSGLIPGAGGTYGSIVAAVLFGFIYSSITSPKILFDTGIALILITFAISMFSTPGAIKELGKKKVNDKKAASGDFNAINIDEAHGMAIACFPVFWVQPENWITFLSLSFAAFRYFDIRKPLKIATFEKKMSAKRDGIYWKSLIITLDDTLAGLYAGIVTSILMIPYILYIIYTSN